MALPSLVAVLAVALAGVGLGVSHVQCVDAARVGVRMLARGESVGASVGRARAAAPTGARLSAATADGMATMTVTAAPPPVLAALGVGGPEASATALLEQP